MRTSIMLLAMASALVAAAADSVDAKRQIRLLFVYEAGAKTIQNGSFGMRGFADQVVAQMNRVLANSDLDDRFEYTVAGVANVAATQSNLRTAYSAALRAARNNPDAGWEGLYEARLASNADMTVVLIAMGDTEGEVGLSRGLTAEYTDDLASFATAEGAVSVCAIESAMMEADPETYPNAFQVVSHEVAHNLGCGHSRSEVTKHGPQSYYYSCGLHYWTAGDDEYARATVMAYRTGIELDDDGNEVTATTSGGMEATKGFLALTVPYFSGSPRLTDADFADKIQYKNDRVGECDNRRVLLNTYDAASRWHLGVEISKAKSGDLVRGSGDLITLAALSDGATIYYTTDGTEPTAENGTKYEEPFSLSASATVKARAYDSTGDAGGVYSHDYVGYDTVLGSPGFEWTTTMDYPWTVDGDALKSGYAPDYGSSTLAATFTAEDGATLSFEYQIAGDIMPYLVATLDGTKIIDSSDETGWTAVTRDVSAGSHTLAFDFYPVSTLDFARLRNVALALPEPPAVIPGTVSFEETTQWNVALDEAKEWAVVGDKPIFFTIPSCTNVFTVAFDADIPDAAGTVFGFLPSTASAKGDYVSLRRDADGAFYGAYKSTNKFTDTDASFFASAAALSSGGHRITVTYDYRNGIAPLSIRGTSASVDDALFYHSKGLSFSSSDRVVSLFSIGGAAVELTATDVLAGLKVKNLTVIPGMFKDQATGADRLATVNGVAAKDAAKNLELVRMFGLSPDAAEVAFTIDGIDASAMTLDATVSPPLANGTLSVQGRESLASPWIRAKVWHGPGASAWKVSLSDGDLSPYRFFRLSAEPGSYGKGSEAAD